MFILSNTKKFKRFLVDAELETDAQIVDATNLSLSTVRTIKAGGEVSLESLHAFSGGLLRRAESAKTPKAVNA